MSLEDTIRRHLPDPTEFEYSAYGSFVVGANDAMRLKLRKFFREIGIDTLIRSEIIEKGGSGESMEYSIYSIGSDGRNEKGPTSPHDILILTDNDSLQRIGAVQEVLEQKFLQLFVSQNDLVLQNNGQRYATSAHRVFSDLEAKSITNGDAMFAYKQLRDASWPSRILDADLIMPVENKGQLNQAKRNLVTELREGEGGKLGVFVRGKEKDRLKNHAKIVRTGKNTLHGVSVEHFDLKAGVANYQLSEDIGGVSVTSFKHGPLRLIQTAVVLRIIDLIRKEDHDELFIEEVLSEMETQTTRKLGYLDAMNITNVSSKVMSDLIDNYQYFLWLFHRSEYAYYAHRQTQISFDSTEVHERLMDVILQVGELVNEGKVSKNAIVL